MFQVSLYIGSSRQGEGGQINWIPTTMYAPIILIVMTNISVALKKVELLK